MPRSGRVAPMSAKAIEDRHVYAMARQERARMAGYVCEGATPACPPRDHVGTVAHHVRRRKGQADVHAVEHLRWLCWDGHEWIHGHVGDAKTLGLLESSW